jgi:uncharacterized membrane protein
MDRIELKKKAQEMIKGNKWYLWKPIVLLNLYIFLIAFVIGFSVAIAGASEETINLISGILGIVGSMVETLFMVGYAKYCLDFVRGKKSERKSELKDIFGFATKHFWTIFLVDLLVALIIFGGCILLVIPGIIFAIGHTFYQEVCVDNIDASIGEIISKSWQLTNGHKVDIFVLMLSFIGWTILAALTFGILYIWLFPYMLITFVLLYEQLNDKKA